MNKFGIPILIVACLPLASLLAKPTSPHPKGSSPKASPSPSAAPTPTPTPSAVTEPPDPLAHWLLQQDGGDAAITLPLAQILTSATGKQFSPANPADPIDAGVIAKLGAALDKTLPWMNQPNSPAHAVGRLDEVASFFEDLIAVNCAAAAGWTVSASPTATGYPAFQATDSASGKAYYFGVTLYPTGGREAAARAFRIQPSDAAKRMSADGCCLLIGIEHNGKTGKELAFLNWELIDVTKLKVRLTADFEAGGNAVHTQGATLTDGRKGRD